METGAVCCVLKFKDIELYVGRVNRDLGRMQAHQLS